MLILIVVRHFVTAILKFFKAIIDSQLRTQRYPAYRISSQSVDISKNVGAILDPPFCLWKKYFQIWNQRPQKYICTTNSKEIKTVYKNMSAIFIPPFCFFQIWHRNLKEHPRKPPYHLFSKNWGHSFILISTFPENRPQCSVLNSLQISRLKFATATTDFLHRKQQQPIRCCCCKFETRNLHRCMNPIVVVKF